MLISPMAVLFFTHAGVSQKREWDPCPMRIGVNAHGDVFSNRFHGHYKTSMKLLSLDLKSGCYNDANPAPVSSVTIKLGAGAPVERVALLYRVLEENGWPKSRIVIEK